MTIRIGINGFGRIGRVALRAAQERVNMEIVAINDLLSIEHIAYLLKYDSTHGQFKGSVTIKNNRLIINGKNVKYTTEKNPIAIPWKESKVDVVIESTGMFLTTVDANKHIIAGASKVILTGPSKDNTPMFVMGVNHHKYNGENILSNASCTTNCLAPLAKVIHDNFIILEGLMTTIHAVTATQKTVDSPIHKDWRSGRSAYQNIIPTSTGAAEAVSKVIPELYNKLTGISFRVPISNVSVVDLTVRIKTSSSYEDICNVIKHAVAHEMKNIMGYSDEEIVSSDFNGNKLTSIFDSKSSILLNRNFVKLISWYDNETGYSNKILDLIDYITQR
ncbi:type I glyceraldehyde-3-phosphate dehydrogenase [Blochmannia endosymbiont of Camponotus (Colobopsis) obliquus]|uniref:type I glyceraldehyde-3-phosphate dehydrogenase n=1 Tax=Blochmannia endosymbiont of Camponotus (Colobopsis) obliquus TaxID=1505597 RepID=UPI00061A81BB|nr:type I glyceraldehyde-3-phosphate dehydrogenase [Blochmannia endosymbiont of Camponotus (Colobopsis) obliquus]AKC60592.1 glyceraldehyde-3-phosphate dehydrogenase A [Blochmannia endosymbiont of Camponotus (Colobopsis) obliquus]